jgi:DNA-binding IclR family transcriptional regulator
MKQLVLHPQAYAVPGLERGLRLLLLFRPGRVELGAPQIARDLALPRSSTFRLLQTLEALEFVERGASGNFRLGPAVLRLGFGLVATLDVVERGHDVLEKLCKDTNESTQLAILDGRELVVVMKKTPSSTFVSNVQVGTRMPTHATVVGRILLQDHDRGALRRLYPDRLKVFTPRTPKTAGELERLIEQDRLRGYAVSESAYENGISAIAAPIRNHERRVVAALSIIVARPRL